MALTLPRGSVTLAEPCFQMLKLGARLLIRRLSQSGGGAGMLELLDELFDCSHQLKLQGKGTEGLYDHLYKSTNQYHLLVPSVTESQIIIIMAKRTLPIRATRGQLPPHLREPPSPLKRERTTPKPEPQEAQRKEIENKRKSQQIANLRKYPFGRAVHYFVELDSFPRLEGHVSYAIDANNALQNTFSKDERQLGPGVYGDVLNRKLLGLPSGQREYLGLRKENRCKNVASSYLYENEDKKYQIDRMICTLKIVLNRLNAGASLGELSKFDVLKKDAELELVLEEAIIIDEKMEIVKEKLQALRLRKQVNAGNWLAQDKTYYYHSLNQKLHNQIADLKQNLADDKILGLVYKNDLLKLKDQCFFVRYYHRDIPCLASTLQIKSTLPVCVFSFEGGSKVFKMANQIIAKKCQSLGETTYYQVKDMMKNLFDLELVLKSDKVQSYANYQKCFRKRCQQIKKSSLQAVSRNKEYSLLDRFVREGELSLGSRTQISGRECVLVIIFYWLCLGLTQLAPFIDVSPDLLTFISSDYFPKVYSLLVSATASPTIGMMCAAIEGLSDLFSKPDPFTTLPVQLLFEYNSNSGLGLLLRQDVETETEPSARTSSALEEDRCIPSKKIKRDNN